MKSCEIILEKKWWHVFWNNYLTLFFQILYWSISNKLVIFFWWYSNKPVISYMLEIDSFKHCNPLQGSTGVYREIPVMKTGTLHWEQGFPVMKTGFSKWELTYREFHVSLTGFGFAVYVRISDRSVRSVAVWK